MSRHVSPILMLLLLAAGCFTLNTLIQPRALEWTGHDESRGVVNALLGDSRKLFANHLFVEADVSFHGGYYPSVFDQASAPKDSRHMTAAEGSAEEEEHERQMNFLGPPRDWIERFGRHFMITEHSHLAGKGEREILPWLKFSAELDPQRINTYTVAAYWLRDLGKVNEAEAFLREGLRNNPGSYEILFDLGRLYNEKFHDPVRARHVWELALRRWRERELKQKEPDVLALEQITVHLGQLDEQAGNLKGAIEYLELARKASPHPAALERRIQELKEKTRPQS